jgi:glycosyltransferase involved in cell wall biosynthesis
LTTIYVDLTDVMLFLRRGGTLTGIQRVEVNALWEIMRLPRRLPFKGLVVERSGACHAFDLSFLADQSTFDPEEFHRRGCQDLSDRRPDDIRLKQRLAAHPGPGTWRRIQRLLIKAGIFLQARLNPAPLMEAGLLRPPADHPSQRGVQRDITLQPSDVYVCLGTAWNRDWSTDIAERHAARGGKVVQMIHDLVPVLRTDLHEGTVNSAFGRWLDKMARCTTQFVCVSQNTARDLAGHLQAQGHNPPIRVTPLAHEFKGQARGARPPLPENARPALRGLDGQPFVICVGSVEGRKNGARLIDAWVQALAQTGRRDVTLVFSGRPGWLAEAFSAALARATAQGVRILVIEGCTDDDLAWLYSHALFSAYPSLYEGWGLPVGESLWFGTPCLASNATSIPEVGGDLARYYSPLDMAAMTDALVRALSQPGELEATRRAIQQAPLRAWRDHGHDLLQACEEHALQGSSALTGTPQAA